MIKHDYSLPCIWSENVTESPQQSNGDANWKKSEDEQEDIETQQKPKK